MSQQRNVQDGSRVELKGIVSRPEINGCRGVVIGKFDAQKQRWPVLVIKRRGTREEMLLKPTNLVLLAETDCDLKPTNLVLRKQTDSKGSDASVQDMKNISSQPAFLFSFQTVLKQLGALFRGIHPFRFRNAPVTAIGSRIGSQKHWLLLVAGGHLCAMVVHRLLCLPGEQAIESALRHAAAVASRRHFFKETWVPTFDATLEGVKQARASACRPRSATRSNSCSAVLYRR
jgi:hypothetical protein